MQPTTPLVLTIDDDDMTRMLLKEVLTKEGFDVYSATNGIEGLEALKHCQPNLVLLDVMMPEMNGFECLQAIRALPNSTLLPIVMLTGADDVDSIHRLFDLGATDFIAKPINWPTLQHRLHYLLRASKALGSLATSEAMLRNAQRIARLGNLEWDVHNDSMVCSEEMFSVMGITARSFKGKSQEIYDRMSNDDVPRLKQAIDLCLNDGQPICLDLQVKTTDGTCKIVEIQGQAVRQLNDHVHIHGTVQDITERRSAEEKVRFLSYYDALTSLPNRSFFKEILGQAINYCDRCSVSLAALFINLKKFGRINEVFGPAASDAVLKEFSIRLTKVVRDSDFVAAASLTFEKSESAVARLNDSEFTLLLNHIQDTRDSVKVAQRILEEMSTPFIINGHEIYLELNIGIAVYPDDGPEIDTFIKKGESAMNHAYEHDQSSYQFYSQHLNEATYHRLSMENNLRRGVTRDEFVLHYQPKINLKNNQIVGMEALIRWQHPELGFTSPDQFIPIAEDAGLIVPVSEWVLNMACRQMRLWEEEGLPPMVMAVNISASHFRHSTFLSSIKSILKNTGLEANKLKLELTESVLLGDIKEVMYTLTLLNEMNVEISIDDFGTGYSSLAYLKKLPISELKIDRSFIHDIPGSEDDMVITSAIIALGKNLGLEIVAEGVETEQQADFLRKQGCDVAQGFLYSKAISAKDFSIFVRTFNSGLSLLLPFKNSSKK